MRDNAAAPFPVTYSRNQYTGAVDGAASVTQARARGSRFPMDTVQQLTQAPAGRQCAYCGISVPKSLTQCPHCREALPEVSQLNAHPVAANRGHDRQIRRALLYMLLAAVIHYFAGGYSAMNLPYPINSIVTIYLSPLLFLSGLGLIIHRLLSRRRN
jgi:hypothetical protein